MQESMNVLLQLKNQNQSKKEKESKSRTMQKRPEYYYGVH